MKVVTQQRPGFTLVEIMIVIGIVAMVMAMGMPSIIQTMKKDPLRKAVSDIVEGCSHARARAILSGVPAELVIRASDGQLTVRQVASKTVERALEGSEPGERPVEVAPSNQPVFSAHLHEDIAIQLLYVNLRDQMEAEEARVRFYSNGTSDEFTIVLESKEGVRKISLDCVTGLPDVGVMR